MMELFTELAIVGDVIQDEDRVRYLLKTYKVLPMWKIWSYKEEL